MNKDLGDFRYEADNMRVVLRENEERIWQLEQIYPTADSEKTEVEPARMKISESEEGLTAAGSLGLRLAVSILLLVGFLMFHIEEREAFGLPTQRVVEAVCRDAGLQ